MVGTFTTTFSRHWKLGMNAKLRDVEDIRVALTWLLPNSCRDANFMAKGQKAIMVSSSLSLSLCLIDLYFTVPKVLPNLIQKDFPAWKAILQ